MSDFFDGIWTYLQSDAASAKLRALIILGVGWFFARVAARFVAKIVGRNGSAQRVFVARRVTFYAIIWLTLLAALDTLGLDLGVLLGAAGVLTVALGFASQTSASNLISGMFLLGERPFVVGDLVRIGTTEGEVLSIDWLSVKIRTWENTFVRIPNESLIKGEITNLTRFEIRRMDVELEVEYETDLAKLEAELLDMCAGLTFCLEDPTPLLRVVAFGASGVKLNFFVWTRSEGYFDSRTQLLARMKRRLEAAGVRVPFHQVVVREGDGRGGAAASSEAFAPRPPV